MMPVKNSTSLNGSDTKFKRPGRMPVTAAVWLIFLAASLACCGCKPDPVAGPEPDNGSDSMPAPDPLSVLVVGDAELGPRIKRQWSAERDGILTIVDISLRQWVENKFTIPKDVDLVVYPPQQIGELVENNQIRAYDRDLWNGEVVDKDSYFEHYRRSIGRYDSKPYALPLGNPQLAMIVQESIFRDQTVDVPTSWTDWGKALPKINLTGTPLDDQLDAAGIDFPLAEGWAAWTLLARVAPNVRVRGNLSSVFDRRTMEPLIDSPPFVAALEQLKQLATKRSLDMAPRDLYRLSLAGNSLAAVTWPAQGFQLADETEGLTNDTLNEDQQRERLSIRPLPESQQLYQFNRQQWKQRPPTDQNQIELIGFSGLVVSVTRNTEYKYSALELASWLASPKMASQLLADSPLVGVHRASQLADPVRWTGERMSYDLAEQYVTDVARSHQQAITLMFPRIPSSRQYLDLLDQGVREYLRSDRSAEDVLGEVADQWRELTKQIGINKQYEAMRRESGFE